MATCSIHRRELLPMTKVDKSMLRIGMQQRHIHRIPHIQPLLPANHFTLDRRIEDPNIDTLVAGPANNPVEALPNTPSTTHHRHPLLLPPLPLPPPRPP